MKLSFIFLVTTVIIGIYIVLHENWCQKFQEHLLDFHPFSLFSYFVLNKDQNFSNQNGNIYQSLKWDCHFLVRGS